jgi:hypothetical protein
MYLCIEITVTIQTGGLLMSRKWLETVQKRAAPEPGRRYLLRVAEVEKKKKRQNNDPPGVRIGLEFWDSDQEGCTHEQVLPLPIQTEGITAEFLRACGMTIQEGAKIDFLEATSRYVIARFAPDPISGDCRIVRFELFSKEIKDGKRKQFVPEQSESGGAESANAESASVSSAAGAAVIGEPNHRHRP